MTPEEREAALAPFAPSPELQAQRAKALEENRQIARDLRAQIRAAGPSGLSPSGRFVLDTMVKTQQPLGVVVRILTALEIAGFIRLEGSHTLVSEELPEPYQAAPGLLDPPMRPIDRPLAASAEPLTLSDM